MFKRPTPPHPKAPPAKRGSVKKPNTICVPPLSSKKLDNKTLEKLRDLLKERDSTKPINEGERIKINQSKEFHFTCDILICDPVKDSKGDIEIRNKLFKMFYPTGMPNEEIFLNRNTFFPLDGKTQIFLMDDIQVRQKKHQESQEKFRMEGILRDSPVGSGTYNILYSIMPFKSDFSQDRTKVGKRLYRHVKPDMALMSKRDAYHIWETSKNFPDLKVKKPVTQAGMTVKRFDMNLWDFIWKLNKGKRVLSREELFKLIINLIEKVQEMHDKQLVHDDISPLNVLISLKNLELAISDIDTVHSVHQETPYQGAYCFASLEALNTGYASGFKGDIHATIMSIFLILGAGYKYRKNEEESVRKLLSSQQIPLELNKFKRPQLSPKENREIEIYLKNAIFSESTSLTQLKEFFAGIDNLTKILNFFALSNDAGVLITHPEMKVLSDEIIVHLERFFVKNISQSSTVSLFFSCSTTHYWNIIHNKIKNYLAYNKTSIDSENMHQFLLSLRGRILTGLLVLGAANFLDRDKDCMHEELRKNLNELVSDNIDIDRIRKDELIKNITKYDSIFLTDSMQHYMGTSFDPITISFHQPNPQEALIVSLRNSKLV